MRPHGGYIRRLTEAQEAEVVVAYRRGDSLRAIAARVALSREGVRKLLLRHHVPRRPVGRRRKVRDGQG